MNKKAFHSQLFRRKIEVTEQDYWPIVYGETLFRIDELEIRKCTCFKCTTDLENYKDLLTRLRSASILHQNKEPYTEASGLCLNFRPGGKPFLSTIQK